MASYIGTNPPQQRGIVNRFQFTATANQTVFTGADANGVTLFYISSNPTLVFLNGVQLVVNTDYTQTDNDTITLASGATVNDEVEIMGFGSFDLNNAATTRSQLGLGTAATKDVGTSANNVVQLNGSAALPAVDGSNLTGIASISWQAVKTANFTAVANEGYVVNTTSGTVVVTLPSSPSVGDNVAIVDYAGTFNSNNCTVNPNGNKIEGSTNNQVLQTNRVAINLTYIDSTQGWLVTSEGSSTPITAPVITWDTASGTLGTITDAQRSGGYSLSSAGGSANIGTAAFSITTGSLPTGLSISSSTGVISGTVTNPVSTSTTSNFTVTASIAASGYTETRNFSITVNAPIITFTTASGTLGNVADSERSNGSYTLSPVTATVTSGTLTYAVTTGALPSSVSLNSSTGAITGNFDAVGSNTTTQFTITATETSSSVTAARQFSITVLQLPPNITSITGNIYTSTASNLTINVTNTDGTADVVFKEGATTLATLSNQTITNDQVTVAVPAAVYNQNTGDTISITVVDGATSNAVTKTVTALPSGGTITTSSGYRIHSFTSSGTFTNTIASLSVEYLIIAGGGAGGHDSGSDPRVAGGGGGAGGYRTGTSSQSTGAKTITVGAGGGNNSNGSNSSALGYTSTGGGRGGSTGSYSGGNGGSGGGGAAYDTVSGGSGTSGQGNNGASGVNGEINKSGGGGGAGSAGSTTPGPGGSGSSSSITGSSVTRAGGGGGGTEASGAGSGGSGGGGNGSAGGSGSAGSANTGGGGGGSGWPVSSSASGGSGIVILRYQL